MRKFALLGILILSSLAVTSKDADAGGPSDVKLRKTVTLPVCNADRLGTEVIVGGDLGSGSGVSKRCTCVGIGAGKDAGSATDTGPSTEDTGPSTISFKWCAQPMSDNGALSCSTGTATTCP